MNNISIKFVIIFWILILLVSGIVLYSVMQSPPMEKANQPIPIIEADIKEPSATTIDRIETQKFLDELEAWNQRHGRMKDE